MMWIAVSITLLVNGDERRVENDVLTEDACNAWIHDMSLMPNPSIDPVSGLGLKERHYICEPA